MGKIVLRNQSCPSCGSSDARQVYEDGGSKCFSCGKFFKSDGQMSSDSFAQSFGRKASLEEISKYRSAELKDRGISKSVLEFFNVKVSFNNDGEIDAHYYEYEKDNSYKIRRLPKTFSWLNKSKKLFGQERFSSGGKRLIICEGEIDALSVAEAAMRKYNKIYPVVAIPASTMTDTILENRDWVRSFDEVIICFDEDQAGDKARENAVRVIGIDKAKIAKLPANDANDVLRKFDGNRLLSCIFDASRYIPSGIVSKEELWKSLVDYNNIPSLPYPPCLDGVNSKTKGMRLGEISLFISGTGSGKSSLIREILYHVLTTTSEMVGLVALEESPAETSRKLAGLALNRNPAASEIPIDELKVGFDKIFGDDRVILLDHQGSMSDEGIISKLEYMALAGCKYIFLDHLTIMISEGIEGLSGNESQDKVMNDLLRIVKRHNIWMGLVSHLRKTPNSARSFEEGKLPNLDDIRGSGSTKQISMDVIAFARNMTHPDPQIRNIIRMSVLKCRHTGLTGPVNGAEYDFDTGRVRGLDSLGIEVFEIVEG